MFTGVVRLVAVLFGALIVFSVGSAQAAPGELDPSFGRAGKVVTILGTTDDWVWLDDVELQSDGKIVAAGGSGAFGSEVQRIRYLDGNSNQGDALCFDPVGRSPASCG